MAINYTQLFTQIGSIIKASNGYASIPAQQLVDLDAIMAAYGVSGTATSNAQVPVQGLPASCAGWQSNVTSWRTGLLAYCNKTFQSQDNVISQLPYLTSTGLNQILYAIIIDMVQNSQAVQKCTVTLSSVTAVASNVGNATVLIDKVLDGVSQPLRSIGMAHPLYANLPSELAVPSETMTLQCTSGVSNGGREGSETWTWLGGTSYGAFDWRPEGSGSGSSLTTANSNTSIIQNNNFEQGSSNAPSIWTVTGTPGINVFLDTTTFYRGTQSVKILGNGVTPLGISQAASVNSIAGSRRVLVTFRLLNSGATTGNFTAIWTGTGYTAGAGEQVSISTGTIPTAWTLYSFYMTAPTTVPSDLTLSLSLTGLNNGGTVWIDSLSCTPCTYSGGINATAVAGNVPAVLNDRYTWTVTNDTAGVFQNFFRRGYGIQLPSSTGGGITIPDSLAM